MATITGGFTPGERLPVTTTCNPRGGALRLLTMKPSRVVLPFVLLLVVAGCAGTGSTTTPGPEPSGSGVSTNAAEEPTAASAAPAGPSALPDPSTPPSAATTAGSVGSSVQGPPEGEELTLLPTKGGAGATLTLTGIPTAGVEARCWLLDGYLLIGVPTALLDTGQRITVTGRAEPGLMTTCQQGIPLRVESAVPA